jgi:DNA-binding IclR family transcriptional regulator
MPIAAISVSAINGRLGPERRQEVARLIQRSAAKFAAVLQGMRRLT